MSGLASVAIAGSALGVETFAAGLAAGSVTYPIFQKYTSRAARAEGDADLAKLAVQIYREGPAMRAAEFQMLKWKFEG
jgi:hypothetical protein